MHADDFAETELPEADEQAVLDDRPGKRRWYYWLFLRLIFVLAFCWFAGLILFIDIFGHYDQAQPAQAIIILGSRVEPDGKPGDSLRARSLQAVALYRRGLAKHIICTGGRANQEPVTEALSASNLAIIQGVSPSNIHLETSSTNTWENAVNAVGICRQEGWTHVIVVSDPYHLWRAYRDFRSQGLTVYPSPARNCARNRHAMLRLQWTARESLAVTRDLTYDVGRYLRRTISHSQ